MKCFLVYMVIIITAFISCSSQSHKTDNINIAFNDSVIVGGSCEGCEAIYESPIKFEKLNWRDTLPDYFDKGPKLLVHGTVYKPGGKIPAPNVVIYIYHTNQQGIYEKKGDEKGWAKRHGYIRGWVKTNESGQYEFYTLKPAAYPDNKIPAHIHITIKEPNFNAYWIDEFLFDGDAFLTDAERKRCENRGGNGIVALENKNNMLVAERDIILGLNIRNYPQKEASLYEPGLLPGEQLPYYLLASAYLAAASKAL